MKENITIGSAKQFEHLKVDHYSWDPQKSLNDGLYDDDQHETLIPIVEQNNQHVLEVIIRLVRMMRNMVICTAYVLQIQMVSQM